MPYTVQLPDGSEIEFPDDVSKEQARTIILSDKRFNKYVPKSSIGQDIKDLGASLVSGGSGLAGLANDAGLLLGISDDDNLLTDIAQGGKELSQGMKSERLKTKEAVRDYRVQQASKQGWWEEFKTAFTETGGDPKLLINFVTEQLPQLVGPAAAGKAMQALKYGPEATLAVVKGIMAAQQGVDVGGDTYREAYEKAKARGASDEEAQNAAQAAGLSSAAGAGATSYLLNSTPLGAGIERRLAGIPGTGRLRTAGGEALTEFAEEAGGKFLGNASIKGFADPEQALLEGTAQAGALGALGGGALGAALGKAPTPERPPGQEPSIAEALRKRAEGSGTPPAVAPTSPTQTIPEPTVRSLTELEGYREKIRRLEAQWTNEKNPKKAATLKARIDNARDAYASAIVKQQAEEEQLASNSAFTNYTPPQGSLFDEDLIIPERETTQEEQVAPAEVNPNQLELDLNNYDASGNAVLPGFQDGGTDFESMRRDARADSTPEATLSIGKIISVLNESGIRGGKPIAQLKNLQEQLGKFSEDQYINLDGYRDLPKLRNILDILTPVAENSTAKNAEVVRNFTQGLQRVYETNLLQRDLMDTGAMPLPDTLSLPFNEGVQDGSQNGSTTPDGNTRGVESRKSVRTRLAKTPPGTGTDGQGLIDADAGAVGAGQRLQRAGAEVVNGGNTSGVGLATNTPADAATAGESVPTGVGVSSVPAGNESETGAGVPEAVSPKTWLQQREDFAKRTGAVSKAGGNYLKGRQNKKLATAVSNNSLVGVADSLVSSKNAIAKRVGELLRRDPSVSFLVDDDTTGEKQEVGGYTNDRNREIAAEILAVERVLNKYGDRYSPDMLSEPLPELVEVNPDYAGATFKNLFFGAERPDVDTYSKYLDMHLKRMNGSGGIEAVKRAFNRKMQRTAVKGTYNPDTNTVSVPEMFSGDEATLTHEIMHALVHKALDKPNVNQKSVVRKLNDLFEYAKTNYVPKNEYDVDHYGFTDIHEFVSEAWSNPEFQVRLNKLQYDSGTVWSKFVDLISNLLGIKDKTALTETLALTEELLNPGTTVVKGRRTKDTPARVEGVDAAVQDMLNKAVTNWEAARSSYLQAKDKQPLSVQGKLYDNMLEAAKPLYEAANNFDETFKPEEQKYAQTLLDDIPPKQVEAIIKRYNPSDAKNRQRTATSIDTELESMVRNRRTVGQLLGYIAENGTSPMNRRVATALMNLPVSVRRITMSPAPFPELGWLASFNEPTNSVAIHRTGDTEYALLHELTHAATVYAMNARHPSAKIITKLYNEYGRRGRDLYGFENEKEFIAEAFTNPEFQEELRRIGGQMGTSIWQRFVKAVRKLLGLDEKDDGAVEQLLKALPDIGKANNENLYAGWRNGETNPALARTDTTSLADQADMVASPVEANRVWDKLRTFSENYVDALTTFDAKNRTAYGGREEINGLLNPSLLAAQAQDNSRIVEQGTLRGKVTTLPSGLSVADDISLGNPGADVSPTTKAAHDKLLALGVQRGSNVSVKELYNYVVEKAEAEGITYDRATKNITTILNLIRIGEIRKRDNDIEQQAANLDAVGKVKEAKKMREAIFGYSTLRSPGIADKAALDAAIDNAQRIFTGTPELQIIQGMMDVVRLEQIDEMVKAGRLTREKADAWQEATAYVPFERLSKRDTDDSHPIDRVVIDKSNRASGLTSLHSFKNLIGSDSQVSNVVDSFAKTIVWMQGDTVKNNAVRRSMNVMELLGRAKQIASSNSQSVNRPEVVRTFIDGVPTYYEVPDTREAIAFQALDNNVIEELRWWHKAAQTLRIGITALPPFTFKQIAEDIHRSFVYSGVKEPLKLIPKILVNFPQTVWANWTGRPTRTMQELSSLGVIGGVDYTRHNPLATVKEVSGVPDNAGLVRKSARKLLRLAEGISVASDMAVRAAIYEQSLKEGESIELAQHRAREIINFSRRGASRAITGLTTTIPFFNAYVQGLSKLARAATGTGVVNNMSVKDARNEFYRRISVLTAIGFAYALSVVGDDEYEQLDDTVRDFNWVIPGASKEFTLAIPLPRDLGLLFKTIPERVVRYMYHDGNEDVGQMVREVMKQGGEVILGGSFTPAAIKPLLEGITNYSFFMGRPLESQSQQQMQPWMRYNAGTSDTTKALGQATADLPSMLQISPIKAENYIRGMLGTTGSLALAIGDAIINPSRADRPVHKMVASQLTGASAFMKDEVGTRWQNQFYDLYEKTTQVANTYRKLGETDPLEADEYAKENIGYLMLEDAVRAVHKDMSSFREQLEYVQNSQDLDPEQKREIIVEINKMRAALASRVISLRAAVNQYE